MKNIYVVDAYSDNLEITSLQLKSKIALLKRSVEVEIYPVEKKDIPFLWRKEGLSGLEFPIKADLLITSTRFLPIPKWMKQRCLITDGAYFLIKQCLADNIPVIIFTGGELLVREFDIPNILKPDYDQLATQALKLLA